MSLRYSAHPHHHYSLDIYYFLRLYVAPSTIHRPPDHGTRSRATDGHIESPCCTGGVQVNQLTSIATRDKRFVSTLTNHTEMACYPSSQPHLLASPLVAGPLRAPAIRGARTREGRHASLHAESKDNTIHVLLQCHGTARFVGRLSAVWRKRTRARRDFWSLLRQLFAI